MYILNVNVYTHKHIHLYILVYYTKFLENFSLFIEVLFLVMTLNICVSLRIQYF